MKKIILLCIVFLYVGCANDKYYYRNNAKVKLSPVENDISRTVSSESTSSSTDNSTIDYYTTTNDKTVGVTTKILVKFIDNSNLDSYLTEFNLSLVKEMSNNLYLLEVEDNDLTIDVANSLYEKDDIKYAHPDFIKKLIKR